MARPTIKERKQALKQDGCVNCGQPYGHTDPDRRIEFDHYEPLARGGLDDEGNLHALCGFCNRYKGAWTIEELNTHAFYEWREDLDWRIANTDRRQGDPIPWPREFDWATHQWADGAASMWIHGELFDVPVHPRDAARLDVPLHEAPQYAEPLGREK